MEFCDALGGASTGGVVAVPRCCVCLQVNDYRGTALVKCDRCHIHVHVKCYGVSIPSDGSRWVCEPCQYMEAPLAAGESQRMQPNCVVCPTEGGALRQTNQPGVWCHVLCMNWVPELSHSLTGDMDEEFNIQVLNRSRESLKCIICHQKGGCIQCISGRCPNPFHVICAMRVPSDAVFIGYNNDKQVYHCRSHMKDVVHSRDEMIDVSWKENPLIVEFLKKTPVSKGKCRVCNAKVPPNTIERHEAVCLVGWLTREEVKLRRKRMEELKITPAKVDYGATGRTNAPGTPSKSSKNRKSGHPVRPCPQCGELIRETLMMGHMKNVCSKRRNQSHGGKHPVSMKRKHSSQSVAQIVDLTEEDSVTAAPDLSDVLFATWPGQGAGSLLDSTNFWKILGNNFFSTKPLLRKRMESLCKNLCGASLEDMGDLSQQLSVHDTLQCADTVLFERAENPTCSLSLKSIVHRCDSIMRKSRTRCLEDLFARPVIELSRPLEVKDSDPQVVTSECVRDLALRFENTNGEQVTCRLSISAKPETAPTEAGGVWIRYHPDMLSTIAGGELEKWIPAQSGNDGLWVSLHDVQVTPPEDDGETLDELTPEISLLVEKLREQTRQNRYSVRALCRTTQRQEIQDELGTREKVAFESYYREYSLWKTLCKCLLVGYREFWMVVPNDDSSTDDGTAKGEDGEDAEPVDDGTCVVCFDGQSPESNPIIFCDRCDLAVHQHCYGIQRVPTNEFYCDRCRLEDEGRDSAGEVYCQLCPLRDGAFKKTVDGKWVHVVCALWCPGVWIGNLQTLSDIKLVDSLHRSRFSDTIREVNALIAPQQQDLDKTTTSSLISRNEHALQHGSLCRYCRVACGRTIKCCHSGCTSSFHPLCAWFEGNVMTVKLRDDKAYIYSGGGNGLVFAMYCEKHSPSDYSDELRHSQKKNRRRFRIDSFFKSQSKLQPVRRLNGQNSAPLPDQADDDEWTDRELCAACFDYASPALDVENPSQLNKRQLMLRCQYCSTFIHAACSLLDIDDISDLFQSNWICERCIKDQGKKAVTACVVCDRAGDYMMPCIGPSTPPAITASPDLSTNHGHDTSSGSCSDRWVHVLCAKMTKAKIFKRHQMLCASPPAALSETTGRCDICQARGRNLVNCGGCSKRFHPTCAARKKYYVSRSSKSEWKFFCPTHPPQDAAYDEKRQAWFTGEILSHLHELRLQLERGRMIVEMARQRDRQKKRMLNLCMIKKMELSMEMILKKRPTPIMKEVYQQFTGEVLEDVPKRVAPAPSRPDSGSNKGRVRTRVQDETGESVPRRTSLRSTASDDNGKRSAHELNGVEGTPQKRRRIAEEEELTPSRRGLRHSTEQPSEDSATATTSDSARPLRTSTRQRIIPEMFKAEAASASAATDPRRRRNRVLDMSGDDFDFTSLADVLQRVTHTDDFDNIVQELYPGMVE